MAIKERVTRKEYPGAITIVEAPFVCTLRPTIQELAGYLMSSYPAQPSVILGGRIYTEASASLIIGTYCVI